METVTARLEFPAVAGGVEPIARPAIEVRQFHAIHGLDHGIIGYPDVCWWEAPTPGRGSSQAATLANSFR